MEEKKNKIIVRFPPSPTGNFHIGSARTALFNFLFSRKHGGTFLLRFEDTDKKRSKREYEKNILDGLHWLGLAFDEGPLRQSERTDVYKTYLKKLIDEKKAYVSHEEPTMKEKRGEVIRFRNPNRKIAFDDLIRGEIGFDTTDLGDFVIAKSLDEPLYHLAVVVDDFEAGVTHIIRGEDHISNTPRQILIQEALGAPRPAYAHIPLILAPDRSKLSKRHGALALTEYRDRGFLPEALVNYLALLGWNPGGEREIFSLDELVKLFDLSKIQKGGAIFNEEKLRWINKEHLHLLPKEKFHSLLMVELRKTGVVIPTVREYSVVGLILAERVETLSDVAKMAKEGEFDYFTGDSKIDKAKIGWKGENTAETIKHLDMAFNLLKKVPSEDFSVENTKAALWPYAESAGKGSVLWPIRYALSGRDKSPDPFTLATVFGKDETLKRIQNAISFCK